MHEGYTRGYQFRQFFAKGISARNESVSAQKTKRQNLGGVRDPGVSCGCRLILYQICRDYDKEIFRRVSPHVIRNETPVPRSNGKLSVLLGGFARLDGEASHIAGEQVHVRGDSSDDCCNKLYFLGTPLFPAPAIISQARRASARSTSIIAMTPITTSRE
jgi:hypothetical protein